jgi:hypothetical protein
MSVPTINSSLKRLAWAYGCAAKGTDEERDAKALLLRKVLVPVAAECIAIAAELVRLPDQVPDRGDPVYDTRNELVRRSRVVDLALRLKNATLKGQD